MTRTRRDQSESYDDDIESFPSGDEEGTTLLPEDFGAEPQESPWAVEDYGNTAAEESRDEPLAQRLRREVPDLSPGHRPTDPERQATNGFPGRLVGDDRAYVATGDLSGLSAEESAMHLTRLRSDSSAARRHSHADRLDLLEAEMTVLLETARIHTEALRTLARALERQPLEEPGEAGATISRAAREAHDLLLTLKVRTD